MFDMVLWALIALLLLLVVYHHVVYPLLLKGLARRLLPPPPVAGEIPTISLIIPAYREARYIGAKLRDLAALDYPREKLDIVIACDGSPDHTPGIALAVLAELGDRASFIRVVAFPENRGKIAVLNQMIAEARGEIVVLMDASSANAPDFLTHIVAPFVDARIGVVCPGYQLEAPGSVGEETYWRYQSAVKAAEAAVAAPMGAHGAAYAFRRALWQRLPEGVINDDFVLPMSIVAGGARAVYLVDHAVKERETAQPAQDFARRKRIGAGNLQQAWLCRGLASPANPALAFVFLSGKGLRAVMPFLLVALFAASAVLAMVGEGILARLPLVAQGLVYLAAGLAAFRSGLRRWRLFALPHYVVAGYGAALLGAIDLLRGRFRDERRFAAMPGEAGVLYVDPATDKAKRAFDIAVGLCAFAVFAVLLPFLALAIRLDSKGPVFYRQLRVGRAMPDRTDLFYLIKLRTMRVDAEAASGAVWAAKGDPRVTRLGRFLRKTRLDELPQCLNVLRGEMSIVGPRPERPVFFTKLESAIPFYAERTYGLKPGVTGLAQVSTGYDATIDDVRLKILFDHTYALRIRSPLEWLRTDLGIVVKTVAVMGLGMGR